jgi:hypothetical protein
MRKLCVEDLAMEKSWRNKARSEIPKEIKKMLPPRLHRPSLRKFFGDQKHQELKERSIALMEDLDKQGPRQSGMVKNRSKIKFLAKQWAELWLPILVQISSNYYGFFFCLWVSKYEEEWMYSRK